MFIAAASLPGVAWRRQIWSGDTRLVPARAGGHHPAGPFTQGEWPAVLQEAELAAAIDRACAGGDAELAEDAARVAFHRVEGDIELRADLPLRQLARQQPQDRDLPLAQVRIGRQDRAPRRGQLQRPLRSRKKLGQPARVTAARHYPASLTRGRARLVIR